MTSKTFKTVLAAAAIAAPVGLFAATDALAFGGHFGGGGGHFGGGGFGGGHFGGGGFGGRGFGGRHFGVGFGRYGWGPRRLIYVGSTCGFGFHYSNYWGGCVPND
ncbi:hypothetical protein ACRAWG_07110 [Methylobacterium sp. P31]